MGGLLYKFAGNILAVEQFNVLSKCLAANAISLRVRYRISLAGWLVTSCLKSEKVTHTVNNPDLQKTKRNEVTDIN